MHYGASVLKLRNTRGADHLTLEVNDIFTATAEKTGVLILFKYNFVSLNIDFNRVGALYIHFSAHFLRNYNAPKLVNASNNTGRFQFTLPFPR